MTTAANRGSISPLAIRSTGWVWQTHCAAVSAALQVRMCTEKYQPPSKENFANVQQHLTNYAINKDSDNFVESSADDEGSKRSLVRCVALVHPLCCIGSSAVLHWLVRCVLHAFNVC